MSTPRTLNPFSSRSGTGLALLILLALTYLVYRPGLHGPFLFDDHANILANPAAQIESLSGPELVAAASSYGHPPFKRPLSMLSFGVNHYFSGLDPFWFKLTNLLLHGINGLLVFWLVGSLLRVHNLTTEERIPPDRILSISLAVSAAWLLHPINLTSVLYVVQRMTSLASLFLLCGLVLYVLGRKRILNHQSHGFGLIFFGLLVGIPLSLTAKEIGLLLPAYLLVIEWTLFRFSAPRERDRRRLQWLFGVIVGLPSLAAAFFLVLHPEWLNGTYVTRTFTLGERLLTEPRVLWMYLRLLLLPRESEFSLYHDDLAVSADLFHPWTTLPALTGLGAALAGAMLLRRRLPLVAFGILFFFAGHLLESSALGLEIAHEHRNYMPSLGILIALFYLLVEGAAQLNRTAIGALMACAFLALFAVTTGLRAGNWGSLQQLTLINVRHHPESARWKVEAGFNQATQASIQPERAPELLKKALEYYLGAAALGGPQQAGSLISALYVRSLGGGGMTAPAFEHLTATLAQAPVAAFTVTSLVSLFVCVSNGYCQAAPGQPETLLRAILGNTTLTGPDRGKLLAAFARYAFSQADLTAALSHTEHALRADPSHLQHHLNLALLLAYAGQFNQSENLLARVREDDRFVWSGAKVKYVDRMIRKIKAGGGAEPAKTGGSPAQTPN